MLLDIYTIPSSTLDFTCPFSHVNLNLDAALLSSLPFCSSYLGLFFSICGLAGLTLYISATRGYPWLISQFYSDSLPKRMFSIYKGLKSAFLFLSTLLRPYSFDQNYIIKLNGALLLISALVADTNACIQMSNWCDHAVYIWENYLKNYPNGEDLWLECDTYKKVIETFDKEGLVFDDEETLEDNLEIYQGVLETRYKNDVQNTIERLNALNETIPRGPRLGQTGILSHIAPFPRR